MTDFPPNPEDGELWIPSDVFHEIVSNNIRPQKDYSHSPSNNHNFAPNKNAFAPNVEHHQPKKSIPKPLPKTKSRPKSQLYNDRFPGTTLHPNWIGSIGNGIPGVHHGPFQLFPGSNIHIYNPRVMQPTIHSTQMIRVQGMGANFGPKRGGTGVFHPCSTTHQNSERNININQENDGETGVYLNHDHREIIITTTHRKKKINGNITQGNQKSSITKMESMEQREKNPTCI